MTLAVANGDDLLQAQPMRTTPQNHRTLAAAARMVCVKEPIFRGAAALPFVVPIATAASAGDLSHIVQPTFPPPPLEAILPPCHHLGS